MGGVERLLVVIGVLLVILSAMQLAVEFKTLLQPAVTTIIETVLKTIVETRPAKPQSVVAAASQSQTHTKTVITTVASTTYTQTSTPRASPTFTPRTRVLVAPSPRIVELRGLPVEGFIEVWVDGFREPVYNLFSAKYVFNVTNLLDLMGVEPICVAGVSTRVCNATFSHGTWLFTKTFRASLYVERGSLSIVLRMYRCGSTPIKLGYGSVLALYIRPAHCIDGRVTYYDPERGNLANITVEVVGVDPRGQSTAFTPVYTMVLDGDTCLILLRPGSQLELDRMVVRLGLRVYHGGVMRLEVAPILALEYNPLTLAVHAPNLTREMIESGFCKPLVVGATPVMVYSERVYSCCVEVGYVLHITLEEMGAVRRVSFTPPYGWSLTVCYPATKRGNEPIMLQVLPPPLPAERAELTIRFYLVPAKPP